MDNIDLILKALDIEDEKLFRIKVMEMIGSLVLMCHWYRGFAGSLLFHNVIKPSPKWLQNYERIAGNLEHYEEIIWESAPSRAMLLQLREFRKNGLLLDGFENLLKQDKHGRIPYEMTNEELDDIADLVRRLGDARQTTK